MLSKSRPSAAVSGAVYSTNSNPSVPMGLSQRSRAGAAGDWVLTASVMGSNLVSNETKAKPPRARRDGRADSGRIPALSSLGADAAHLQRDRAQLRAPLSLDRAGVAGDGGAGALRAALRERGRGKDADGQGAREPRGGAAGLGRQGEPTRRSRRPAPHG